MEDIQVHHCLVHSVVLPLILLSVPIATGYTLNLSLIIPGQQKVSRFTMIQQLLVSFKDISDRDIRVEL